MTPEQEQSRAMFESLSEKAQETLLRSAKDSLVVLSEKRDLALAMWPSNPMTIAISGYLDCNVYGKDWQYYDTKINQILTIYPELEQ